MKQFSLAEDQFVEAVNADIEGISTLNVPELMEAMGVDPSGKNPLPVPTKYALGFNYVWAIGPIVAFQLFIEMAVLFSAATFFLLLFSRGSISPYDAARLLPVYTVRMLVLGLWMFVRSYIWIPFIGLPLSLYFMPRLALAPVIVASGEAGVFESCRLSMRSTSGHWMGMFLKFILVVIAAFLLWWPMLIASIGVSLFILKIGYLLFLMSAIVVVAFQCAALVVVAAMLA